MTAYLFDTEFIEDGRTIELISIGVVCEDGRELYAENADARLWRANDWVRENVLPHLVGEPARRLPMQIADDLVAFVRAGEGSPEFWAYYADYDWVALCQLFGRMVDLPKGFPMYCLDLRQEWRRLPEVQRPPFEGAEHHALADARWNRLLWEALGRP